MHILDQIVGDTRLLIAKRKEQQSLAAMQLAAEQSTTPTYSLAKKLVQKKPHIIAEFKRKSPSRPNINLQAEPVTIAKSYDAGGASAMSILTEPNYFAGNLDDLNTIRQAVSLPLLRKDFVIDPYQIFEAKANGANLILLIGRILESSQIQDFTALAHSLEMEVLYEIHHLEEWEKAKHAGVDFLGVNCRDLTKFQTNLEMFIELYPKLPHHIPLVAESGISCPGDVARLYQTGYQLFLVGEYLMRQADPAMQLRALRA